MKASNSKTLREAVSKIPEPPIAIGESESGASESGHVTNETLTLEQRRLAINAYNKQVYERRKRRFPGYDAWRRARLRRNNREKYLAELKKNRDRAELRRHQLHGWILWAMIFQIKNRLSTLCQTSDTQMETEIKNPVLEVVNVAESARRLGACEKTLSRKVLSSGIVPDAVLLLGSTGKRSPLFVASRLRELGQLLKKHENT